MTKVEKWCHPCAMDLFQVYIQLIDHSGRMVVLADPDLFAFLYVQCFNRSLVRKELMVF